MFSLSRATYADDHPSDRTHGTHKFTMLRLFGRKKKDPLPEANLEETGKKVFHLNFLSNLCTQTAISYPRLIQRDDIVGKSWSHCGFKDSKFGKRVGVAPRTDGKCGREREREREQYRTKCSLMIDDSKCITEKDKRACSSSA